MSANPPRPDLEPTSRLTAERLLKCLEQIKPSLSRKFRPCAVDAGLGEALLAGVLYQKRVETGEANDLEVPESYLRKVAFRAASRYRRRHPPTIPLDEVIFGLHAALNADAAGDVPSPVMDVVDELPPLQREVFTLHAIDGLTFGETASLLGIAYPTVHRAFKDGRKLLRKKLEGAHKMRIRASA